jgi:[ribosomal protein S5]-alanine N-acetyltransferase
VQVITETSRLKLVKVTKDDCGLLFKLTGNDKVMEFFPGVLSYDETREMIQKILNQYDEYGYCFWKVLLKHNDHFVGIAGLLHQDISNVAEVEISYRMLPEHWNKGYGTEAAKACKEYAESVLGKQRLISLIHPQNEASIRVASKLGAEKSKSIVFMGEIHDVYVY